MENYKKHGGITEETPLPTHSGVSKEPQTDLDYASRKLVADAAIQKYWDSNNVTVLRPHLIPGPHQEKMNGVETYWPVRFQVGREILAPGDGKDPTQWVDVRDVAWFIGQCAEENLTGIYNLGQQQTLSDYFYDLSKLSTAKSELNWISWPELQRIGAGPFHELPMYVPRQEGSFYDISDAKARAAGLRYRKARDVYPLVLEDYYYQYGNHDFAFGLNNEPGLSPEREQNLLSKAQL